MKHIGTQTLETERLILRKFVVDDADDMFNNWASSETVTKFMTWQAHTSVDDTRDYIKYLCSEYENDNAYHWCIVSKESGQAIGSISVVFIKDDIKSAEVGYCLSEQYWHKGIMSESLKRVIEFLFNEVGLNRIEAHHDVNNPNSGGVMKKCGMSYEGTHRQAGMNNTGVCDLAYYAILKSDFASNISD